jgi:hypothetical protein
MSRISQYKKCVEKGTRSWTGINENGVSYGSCWAPSYSIIRNWPLNSSSDVCYRIGRRDYVSGASPSDVFWVICETPKKSPQMISSFLLQTRTIRWRGALRAPPGLDRTTSDQDRCVVVFLLPGASEDGAVLSRDCRMIQVMDSWWVNDLSSNTFLWFPVIVAIGTTPIIWSWNL